MELTVFARFHIRAGTEPAALEALAKTLAGTRAEPGCLGIRAYRATRDACLFYIHSRWRDEAAFDRHATLPHTVQFLASMEAIVDQPREVSRTSCSGSRTGSNWRMS